MDRCDIIMPVWNQLEVTKECVDSIMKTTAYPYRLIIIDNRSDAETKKYLEGLKENKNLNLLLIRNNQNLGFVKAVNQGIRVSEAPYLCIMNNDTITTNRWLGEMVSVMEANPGLGLVNPSSNTSGQFPGNLSVDEYGLQLKCFKGDIQELYTCRGFCMVVRRKVIDDVGILDEAYNIGYFDDTDYCKRAQAHGYRTARAKGAYVYHKENTSFKKMKDNSRLFADNEKMFFKKWGRHVRVGYFLDELSRNKIDDIAIGVARGGHQILIFMKKDMAWPVSLDHFDIRRIDMNPLFFVPLSIYQILKRKRKKKLDFLLTDNKAFGFCLNAIKILHESKVFVNPDKRVLLEAMKKEAFRSVSDS